MARPPPKPEFQAPDEITSVYPIGLLTKSDDAVSPVQSNLGFTPLPGNKSSGKAAARSPSTPPRAASAGLSANGVNAIYLIISLLVGGLLAVILAFFVALLILL